MLAVISKTCMVIFLYVWCRLLDAQNSVRIALAGRESRLRREREVMDVPIINPRGRTINHPVALDRAQLQELGVQEVAALFPRDRRRVETIEYRHYGVPDDFHVLEVHAGADALANRSVELGRFSIILHEHRTVDGVLRINRTVFMKDDAEHRTVDGVLRIEAICVE